MDVSVFRQGEFDDGLFGGFAEEEADGRSLPSFTLTGRTETGRT
jgi:hypothetical protein